MHFCKCVPSDNVENSRLVEYHSSTKKTSFYGKCVGLICLPLLCTGVSCCITSLVMDVTIKTIKKVIDFYTVPILIELRKRIDHENKLFMDACSEVIIKTDPLYIVPNINIMNAIRATDGRARAMIKDHTFSVSFIIDNKIIQGRSEFTVNVYKKYREFGGNPSVIIYGYPEYMAMIVDPSSQYMLDIYPAITSDTQLRRFMLEHKKHALA